MIALILAGIAPAQAIAGETDLGTPVIAGTATTASFAGSVARRGQVRGAVRHGGRLARKRRCARDRIAQRFHRDTHLPVDRGRWHDDDDTVEITPPTKPMGWGNVSHSLALAQVALNQQGITNPTGAELRAALDGGTIMTADGRSVTFAGVLQQRADGMGFGRIAQSYGTTMGAVNRGIKAPATSVAMTTTAVGPKSSPSVTASKAASAPGVAAGRGLTTAAGTAAGAAHGAKGLTTAPGMAAGRGVTTAAGTAAGAGQGAKGLTTAAGATSHGNPHGIVSANGGAHGNGNAYGRGVVTASGSGASVVASGGGASSGASNGVVTGAGSASHVVTADPGRGAGAGNGHGKGKGGG